MSKLKPTSLDFLVQSVLSSLVQICFTETFSLSDQLSIDRWSPVVYLPWSPPPLLQHHRPPSRYECWTTGLLSADSCCEIVLAGSQSSTAPSTSSRWSSYDIWAVYRLWNWPNWLGSSESSLCHQNSCWSFAFSPSYGISQELALFERT